MKIKRQTEVVSISLPPAILHRLDQIQKQERRTRSSVIRNLIMQYAEDTRWDRIYKRGEATARKFNITSEDDIDHILHAS